MIFFPKADLSLFLTLFTKIDDVLLLLILGLILLIDCNEAGESNMHSSKVCDPISVTVEGIAIYIYDKHPSKA